jgi:glycosyltransferase involved in cell wall biosynthesis
LANFPVANVFSRKIEASFKPLGCDLVHVHHPFWLGKKGMRLARRSGIPVILTYHTRLERYTHYFPLPGMVLKNLVAHFLIKRFANHCVAIITPTSSTEEYLRNLGVSALIETIPTGIDIEDYKQWSQQQVQALRDQYVDPGERLLISVSRMAKEKNLDFLITGLKPFPANAAGTFSTDIFCHCIFSSVQNRTKIYVIWRAGKRRRDSEVFFYFWRGMAAG